MESWNSSSSPCDWPEIGCINGTVTEIIIQGTYKVEIIPPSICDLKNLTQIHLAYHAIKGGFPTILYNCSKLEYLDLQFNDFDGPIPDDIYRMSNLRYMDLGANQFTNIPAAIGRLSKLKELFIDGNALNCSIPKEIGKLSNLEALNMGYNQFVQATIPMELGQLKKLKYLWIKYSNLIGEIPETIGNLSSVEEVDLSGNLLNGSIPGGLFRLKNLRSVFLQENKLSGDIPETIGNLSSVEEVDLSGNLLNGSIPGGLFRLKNLRSVFLQENKLSGDIPVEAFNWAGIVLSRNNLTISLREDDYSGPYSSKNLQLCGNQLSRRIPYALQTNECTCKFFDNAKLCVPGGIYDFKQRVPSGNSNSKIGDIAPPIIFLVTSSFFLFLAKHWLRRKQPENGVANYKLTRRKQLENSIADWELIWFQRLDFTESDILLGLTDNNRIGNGGSGTVYLIVIHATGTSVAVKKRSVRTLQNGPGGTMKRVIPLLTLLMRRSRNHATWEK
ncbi:hypothetical protein F0562_012519 [Nyssa sinensis]|uniref:Disease resistance R13L4/SHOC-2-like LRR domain-containing protein n=1 Tax=Nyssa sinensis TaxID=561372 RepID=A0A5J4ZV00_9ASTE|nr:hypothetical protein F0562_012519 [Nyssa sinensis]